MCKLTYIQHHTPCMKACSDNVLKDHQFLLTYLLGLDQAPDMHLLHRQTSTVQAVEREHVSLDCFNVCKGGGLGLAPSSKKNHYSYSKYNKSNYMQDSVPMNNYYLWTSFSHKLPAKPSVTLLAYPLSKASSNRSEACLCDCRCFFLAPFRLYRHVLAIPSVIIASIGQTCCPWLPL